jgi:diacylglycerol kinase family enzyme
MTKMSPTSPIHLFTGNRLGLGAGNYVQHSKIKNCVSFLPAKVKLALIHNPDAFRGEAEGNELRRVFEHAGHSVEYVSTREPNWQRVISPEIARAIIVGGNGTVQLVAPHLKGTPFSVLPFGTANNIAQCLHQTPDPELLASQLDQAQIRHLDLGKVTHHDESESFLETTGMGVFVELILAMQDLPKKLEMEQAASRREKFVYALEQLQAISRRMSITWAKTCGEFREPALPPSCRLRQRCCSCSR